MTNEAPNPPTLRAGYATLSESFGDNVYIKRRVRKNGEEVECVCCGRWCPVRQDSYFCSNPKCGSSMRIADHNEKSSWAGVSTYDVLAEGTQSYFLPRPWNPFGIWIPHNELGHLFDKYLKEKESIHG